MAQSDLTHIYNVITQEKETGEGLVDRVVLSLRAASHLTPVSDAFSSPARNV
jgi:hypothetical protein